MAKKTKIPGLNEFELRMIEEREVAVTNMLDVLNIRNKFNVGDYLIAWDDNYNYSGKPAIVTNSYGAPKKFTVIHTDKHGIPYIKELNKNGHGVGQLMSPISFGSGYQTVRYAGYRFEVDPDYTDAVIMADEGSYDAAIQHRVKSDTFKEITKHNKSLKVNCHDTKELLLFLQSLKVGDVVYKSIKTHFTILKIDPIPTTHNGARLGESDFGEAQDSRGKVFPLNLWTFRYSAIYKGQPRSYNELKDPK